MRLIIFLSSWGHIAGAGDCGIVTRQYEDPILGIKNNSYSEIPNQSSSWNCYCKVADKFGYQEVYIVFPIVIVMV